MENGIIVDEFYSLVKPPNNNYSKYTINIHGITPKDTLNSPTFTEIFPDIKKRLENKTVVAHNEAFDRSVLQKSMNDNLIDYSELNIPHVWEDTMKYCRKNKSKYPSARLNDCCKVEGIELNHHEALSDARACAELYLRV
jgi:DNA polymerase-3 subunit epsilon